MVLITFARIFILSGLQALNVDQNFERVENQLPFKCGIYRRGRFWHRWREGFESVLACPQCPSDRQFPKYGLFLLEVSRRHDHLRNDFISFITYDEEHHHIDLIVIGGTGPNVSISSGLEHIDFTFPTLSALLLAYRQRKARGIPPFCCVNHGPTTPIYYKDPDGNVLETQVDNFDTVEETNEFVVGKEFAENPIATDFDAGDLIQKIEECRRLS